MSLYVITIQRFLTTDMHIQAGQVRGQAGQGRGWIYISLYGCNQMLFSQEMHIQARQVRVKQVRAGTGHTSPYVVTIERFLTTKMHIQAGQTGSGRAGKTLTRPGFPQIKLLVEADLISLGERRLETKQS